MDPKLVAFKGSLRSEGEKHTLTAVVAQLDIIDKQRDILKPGSIGRQQVVLSDWAHSAALAGRTPVGKGYLEEQNGSVVMYAEFFDTDRALETAKVLAELGELTEYSLGLVPREYTEGVDDKSAYVRTITKADVLEASPVLRGAMPNTRTINVKADEGCTCDRATAPPGEETPDPGKDDDAPEVDKIDLTEHTYKQAAYPTYH